VAQDRDIFARGALEAAARLAGRPAGLWTLPKLLFNGQNVD
jgi:dihydrodipicolinate reductase